MWPRANLLPVLARDLRPFPACLLFCSLFCIDQIPRTSAGIIGTGARTAVAPHSIGIGGICLVAVGPLPFEPHLAPRSTLLRRQALGPAKRRGGQRIVGFPARGMKFPSRRRIDHSRWRRENLHRPLNQLARRTADLAGGLALCSVLGFNLPVHGDQGGIGMAGDAPVWRGKPRFPARMRYDWSEHGRPSNRKWPRIVDTLPRCIWTAGRWHRVRHFRRGCRCRRACSNLGSA